MDDAWILVGAGLAGTLLGLDLERRGVAFRVVDDGSGGTSSRVAAGLFNPLLGPRMTADKGPWDALEPFYRRLEGALGVAVFHRLDIERPWAGSLVGPADFPRSGPGWSARVEGGVVRIEGGGWLDIPTLLDAARQRWLHQGVLTPARAEPGALKGRRVVWCGGWADLSGQVWKDDPLVGGRAQAVRGDVLTFESPTLARRSVWIGGRFLLPVGGHTYRWGATHVADDAGYDERPEVRAQLEHDLATTAAEQGWKLGNWKVTDHRWGVRPASRTLAPLIGRHATEGGWLLFNGFAGKGVTAIPRALDTLRTQMDHT